MTHSLPFLTSPELRLGGELKLVPSDFRVDEIPAYLPCGEGEHRFLWIEKENVSAEQLAAHISRVLNVPRDDLGVAGLKDRVAITRQWISVPAKHAGNLNDLPTANIRLLDHKLHQNKLKTGHLKGNQFTITLRNVLPAAAHALDPLLEVVSAHGVPNYFGDQRFGREGETLQLGLQLLAGTKSPGSIPFARRKFLLRLALSAVQSMLFNAVLAERIIAKTLHLVSQGDVMQVVESGGLFVAEEIEAEQPRVARRETVGTGPLFGPKMKVPGGTALELETRVLASQSLNQADFEKFHKLTSGTRRPLVLYPGNLHGEYDVQENCVRLQFTLASGCYATVLLRELMKCDSAALPTELE